MYVCMYVCVYVYGVHVCVLVCVCSVDMCAYMCVVCVSVSVSFAYVLNRQHKPGPLKSGGASLGKQPPMSFFCVSYYLTPDRLRRKNSCLQKLSANTLQ